MAIPVPLVRGGDVAIGEVIPMFGYGQATVVDDKGRTWQLTGTLNEDFQSYPALEPSYLVDGGMKFKDYNYSGALNANALRGIVRINDKYIVVYNSNIGTSRIDFLDLDFTVVGSTFLGIAEDIANLSKYEGKLYLMSKSAANNVYVVELNTDLFTVVDITVLGSIDASYGSDFVAVSFCVDQVLGEIVVFENNTEMMAVFDITTLAFKYQHAQYTRGSAGVAGVINGIQFSPSSSNNDNFLMFGGSTREMTRSFQYSSATTRRYPTVDVEFGFVGLDDVNNDIFSLYKITKGVGSITAMYEALRGETYFLPYYMRIA